MASRWSMCSQSAVAIRPYQGSSRSMPRLTFHAVGMFQSLEMVLTVIWPAPTGPGFWWNGSALNAGRLVLHGGDWVGPQLNCVGVIPELEKILPSHTAGWLVTNRPAPPRS